MALVDSLLAAIVRADGDALVMHVGERPYVVVGAVTTHISTHGLNLNTMLGMITQLLPAEAQAQLAEFGAVEHRLPSVGDDRFTIVAARGGDDIWIEIRRRRLKPVPMTVPAPQPATPPIVEKDASATAPIATASIANASIANVSTAPVRSPSQSLTLIEAASHQPAVILPMTRTVRIEVPSRPGVVARPSRIERLLRVAATRGASSMFLTSDAQPWVRIGDDLRVLDGESALSRSDIETAVLEIAPESGHESIGRGETTEWIADFIDVGRIRCTTFADHRGPGVLLQMIATRAATAEQLGLSREVQALATEAPGLVLIAAPKSGGKSTVISALVDLVNRQRGKFVIALERQIRLVHDNKLALVSQREIRGGAEAAVTAARSALRENPDVLVVDDLLSAEMIGPLLNAAAEGLLVIVSITASSTNEAVQRFIECASPETRMAAQEGMAESFRGAVAQVLLKKIGGGVVAAREVLLATAPVSRLISEGQFGQLSLALESGRKHGMVSFTDVLADLVRSGAVDVREAFKKAPARTRLLDTLKRDGVDISVVDRLA